MQQDLAIVEKVDLEEFVAEAEHDGVPGLQPLLDVDELVVGLELDLFLGHLLYLLVEVDDEPLEQQVFLLEVPVLGHGVGLVGEDVFLL